MQIQRLLLRLQQMLHPVLHNERRVKACCIPGIFWPFSLLAAYQPSPAVAPLGPLALPPRRAPCLAPPAAVPLPRSTHRRAPFSLPPRRTPTSLRPPPPRLLPRLPRSPKYGGVDRKTGGQGNGGRTGSAGYGGLVPGGMPPLPKLHSRALHRRPLFPSSEAEAAASQRRTATCASSSFPGDWRRRSVAARPPGSRAGLRLRFPIAAVAASSSATGARLRLAHPRRRGRQQPGVCATACAATAGAPPLLQHMTPLFPFFIEPFAA
jgi:hypothetical protein